MYEITAAVLHSMSTNGVATTLSVERLALDDPGPSELTVAIDAAGLCHSDLSVMNGDRPRPVPMVLGHEATGIVHQAGSAVRDIAVGQRVVLTFVPSCGRCADCLGGRPALCEAAASANIEGRMMAGGHRLSRNGSRVHHHLGVSAFATRAVVDRGSVVPVDQDVPAAVAALFGCAVLTGAGAVLHSAKVRAGERVAVFGLGGIGLAAVMAARLVGAADVLAVDPVPEKRALALRLGATAVAEPTADLAQLRAMLSGGADVCIEAAGRIDAFETAFDLGVRGARVVSVGLPNPAARAQLSVTRLVAEGKTIVGSYLGDSVPQRDIPRLLGLWKQGRFPVDELLSETLPLRDINAGFEGMQQGRPVRTIVIP